MKLIAIMHDSQYWNQVYVELYIPVLNRRRPAMKYSYKEMPEQMKGTFGDISRSFGFSWKEFVMTIPSPMFLVTTYKSNGNC